MSSDTALRAYSLVRWVLLAALTALGWILLGAVSASADEGPRPSPLVPAAQLVGKASVAASSVGAPVADRAAPITQAAAPLVQPAAPIISIVPNAPAVLSDADDAVSSLPLTGRIVGGKPVTAVVEPVVNVVAPVAAALEPVTAIVEPVAAIVKPVVEQAPLPALDADLPTALPVLPEFPASTALVPEMPGTVTGETEPTPSVGEPSEISPFAASKAANDRAAVSPPLHALEGIGESGVFVSPSGPETPIPPLPGGLDAAASGPGSSLNPASGGGVPSAELLSAALAVPLLMGNPAVSTGATLPDSLSRRPGSSPD